MSDDAPTTSTAAANPLRPLATPADARRAAQVGAVGAALLAVSGAVGSALILADPDRLGSVMRAGMASTPQAADPEVAALMEPLLAAMPGWIAVTGLVVALVYAVLAVVQWRKPNFAIPMILLGLALYGLLSGVQLQITQPELARLAVDQAWTWPVQLVSALLLAVGVRGGWRLYKLERAGVI
jgi:hypothetical protein